MPRPKIKEIAEEVDYRLQQDGISSMFALTPRLDRPAKQLGHLPTLDQLDDEELD